MSEPQSSGVEATAASGATAASQPSGPHTPVSNVAETAIEEFRNPNNRSGLYQHGELERIVIPVVGVGTLKWCWPSPASPWKEGDLLTNQTAAMITGIVRDTDGNLVGGASVYITEGPAQFPDIAALTDAQGRFSLPAPIPGYYRIEVNASGAAPVTATVAITAGQQVQLDISVLR